MIHKQAGNKIREITFHSPWQTLLQTIISGIYNNKKIMFTPDNITELKVEG